MGQARFDGQGGAVRFVRVVGAAVFVLWEATPAAAQTGGTEGGALPPAEGTPAVAEASASVADDIALLTAPAADDRKAAIRRLSDAADRAAVPALLTVLRQDPDADVRRFAIVALANIRDPAAIPTLAETAGADPSPAVRQAATQALATFGVAPTAPVPAAAPPAPPPAPAPGPGSVPSPGAIGVLETAGTPVEYGATTFLQFEGDEPGIEISQVVGAHQGIAIRDGRPRPVVVPTSQIVCRTPCSIAVPNGSYTFSADGYSFELEATGGSQAWQVDPGSMGGWVTGLIFTILGGMALLGGVGMAVAPDDPSTDSSLLPALQWSLIGVGAAGVGGGIALLVLSSGSAERVSDADDWTAARTPSTLASRRADVVGAAWGLRLVVPL